MAVQYITITTRSILSVVVIALIFALIYIIKDILIILFVATIIMSAFNPVVDVMEEKGIARWLAILLLYLVGITAIGAIIWSIIPLLVHQVADFATSAPVIINQVADEVSNLIGADDPELHRYLPEMFRTLAGEITSSSSFFAKAGVNIITYLTNIFTLVIFSYYLLLEHKRVKKQLVLVFPERYQGKVLKAIERIEFKLGVWFRSQIVLMVIVGMMSFVGLVLLDIHFATSLAVLAGLLEILPYFGPFIAAIPAVMVALTQSTWQGIAVISLYIVIQQLENTAIVPKLMSATVGLDPLIVILAIIIGQRLNGPIGSLIAIPAVVVMLIIFSEYREKNI